MAKTELWNRFGETILAAPQLTLAAFLGHQPSVEVANQHAIRFPKTADFQVDRAYDPNFHRLDFAEQHLQTGFLVLCISTWGVKAIERAVHSCSLLQCMHHVTAAPSIRALGNRAAFGLQSLIDDPSEANRRQASDVLKECSALYRTHENAPDSPEASDVWYQLGAPWLALESVFNAGGPQADIDEVEPAQANSTWLARTTVWPRRAADAAAHWSSHQLVRDAMRSSLISWAVSNSADEAK